MKYYTITLLLGAFLCLGSLNASAFSQGFEISDDLHSKPLGGLGSWLFLNDRVQIVKCPKALRSPIIKLEAGSRENLGGQVALKYLSLEGLDSIIIEEDIQTQKYRAYACQIQRKANIIEIFLDGKPISITQNDDQKKPVLTLTAQEGTRLYILSEPSFNGDCSVDACVNEVIKSMIEAGILTPYEVSKKIFRKSRYYQDKDPIAPKTISVKILDVKNS